VILCDTGPMVALFDEADAGHERCKAALSSLPPEPLVTTWPCLTEAMHLLSRVGGAPAQERLWTYVADGIVVLHLHEPNEWKRMRVLMQEYADAPMDLADASLVAAAERLGIRRVFTLDRHFFAYRTHGKRAVPGLSVTGPMSVNWR
jgi:predicted nucleic acid-binding protein